MPTGLAGAFASAMTMAAAEGIVLDKGPDVPTHIDMNDRVLFLHEHAIYPGPGAEGLRLVPAAAVIAWVDEAEELPTHSPGFGEDDTEDAEEVEDDVPEESDWDATRYGGAN